MYKMVETPDFTIRRRRELDAATLLSVISTSGIGGEMVPNQYITLQNSLQIRYIGGALHAEGMHFSGSI